jgi:hypothetical protein
MVAASLAMPAVSIVLAAAIVSVVLAKSAIAQIDVPLSAATSGAAPPSKVAPSTAAPTANAPGGGVTQASKPVDAFDAIAAWRRLDVSRAAVKDQVELCNDDADKFQQVGRDLKPGEAADVGEWNEWAALLRNTGQDLESCLRAYKKQIGLLRADAKTLQAMLPAVKDVKRMALTPKQLAEVTKSAADGEREMAAADQHVAALADSADRTVTEALRALGQAGVARIAPMPSFKELL